MSSRRRALIALSLLGMCILFASGRTMAFDSRSQLTQAVHFCATGHIAARHQLTRDFVPKGFHAGSHVWYDANDIGSTLIMLPAACASTLFGAHNPHHSTGLTTMARSGASLTFSLIGGIGTVFVFLTLARLIGERRAWWWTVAMLFTTAYLAYVKGIWNVLPAAVAVSALVYAISLQFPEGSLPSRTRDGPTAPVTGHPGRILIGAACAVGIAALCRYTLLPFLFIAAFAALLPTIRRASTRQRIVALALLLLLVAPDFWFNQLRSGRFWVPGESAPQWVPLHVTAHYLLGSVGMFFGIQRGLLFYAPLCMLGYVALLALAWRSRGGVRKTWLVLLGCAVAYAVTVVVAHKWNVSGWGPRYLVPLMPALFVAAVVAAEARVIPRVSAYIAAAFGLLTQLPVAFTNWHALLAVVGVQHRAPNGIIGLWRGFLDGLETGHSFGRTQTDRALQVPDTWWWHALGDHPPYLVGVFLAIAVLAVLLTIGARRVHPPPETSAA